MGGIFGGATQLQTGWNRIVYVPLDSMRQPKPDGSYGLYLSFFNEDADGKNPLTEPIYADEDWYSVEHIGIDEGDTLLMLTNYQDGFVWNLFMQNPYVQTGLAKMGFVEQASDYAVTPDYLENAGN